ncbi:MAG: tRNA pseudouridine(13) synthase TruD [archaeon]|nr:tRNA pseudouridine(13) synthase TruD [archaeon]
MYRTCITKEAAVGMHYYLTDIDGTGGRIKVCPEDFVVKEMSLYPAKKTDGHFVIADVTSKNWETNRLIRLLSRTMRISREKIGFAGTKDKRAVTTQTMSFNCPLENMSCVNLKDVEFSNIYTSNRSVKIGDLIGNTFDIKVKKCSAELGKIKSVIHTIFSNITKVGGFPNYFGVQRFGVNRPITHIIGELIVRGNLKKAIETYLSYHSDDEDIEVQITRKKFCECDGDYASIINEMPKTMGFEKTIAEHLIKKPEDYIGAIAKMPSNLQMMFVHAYQSYLFNLMLSKRMERSIPLNDPIEGDIVLPLDENGCPIHENPVLTTSKNIDLVKHQIYNKRACIAITIFGANSVFAEGEMGEIERKVIEQEKITKDDFIITGLPHCTSKGSKREIICPIWTFESAVNSEGYNVKFSLPKGNYATCLMREFMKSEMINY